MYAEREVILCGGTYNSAQLLMLSGFGAADELRRHGIRVQADLPGVGANLSEHVRAGLQFATREPVSFLRELRADRIAFSLLRWWLFGTGPMRHAGQQLQRGDPHAGPAAPARHPAHVQPGAHGRQDLVAAAEPRQTHLLTVDAVLLHPEVARVV